MSNTEKALSRETIDSVAVLAKLEFTESEISDLEQGLNEIIEYAQVLEGAVERYAEGSACNEVMAEALREDIPHSFGNTESLLSQASSVREGQVSVPKVIG